MDKSKSTEKPDLRFTANYLNDDDVKTLIRVAVRELFGTVVVNEGNCSARYLRHLLHDEPRPAPPQLTNPSSETADTGTILCIMSEMHDNWVMSHATFFADAQHDSQRYQFLPMELIGWDDARLYYVILAKILQDLGLPGVKSDAYEVGLRTAYLLKSGQRFANICQRDLTLHDFVRTCIPNEYRALPEPVREALRKNTNSCVTSVIYSLREIWLYEPW